MDKAQLFSIVEHTVLKPEATSLEIMEAVSQAAIWGCRGACIPPVFIEEAVEYRETNQLQVPLVTVIGFPFGYHTEKVIWTELREALVNGADEVDVVGPTYAVKAGDWDKVRHEIAMCREAAGDHVVKIIMETGLLTDDEIKRYCEIISECKIDFAKTSSGFAGTGATTHAVGLMRAALAKETRIKASGGIRTYDQMLALIEAGADVLGMSRVGDALKDVAE